jgi:hypothetical protein
MRTSLHARRRLSALLLAVAVGSGGCHTWKPVTGPSITSPATHESVEYRLTAHTGESRRFVSLQLRNDSLVGQQVGGARPVIPGWPIARIRKVEVRMPSDAPGVILTAALVGLVIVGATVEPFSGGI